MSTIPDMIVAEAKNLPDDLAKEVLDFILFLKVKKTLHLLICRQAPFL